MGKTSLKKPEEVGNGEENALGRGPEVEGAWRLLGTEPRPVSLENGVGQEKLERWQGQIVKDLVENE